MQLSISANSLRLLLTAVIGLAIAPPLFAQEADRAFSREDYQDALESGLYEEAGNAAKMRLQEAVRAGDARELSTVSLLDDLAAVQRLSGEYDLAIQNYELAVELVEENRDMLDLALTEPLLGLGNSYLDSGRADLALEHLERALHVRSVNDGPHSIEQVAALEVLAESYLQMGSSTEAMAVADRLYLIYERNYPKDSLELVPALVKKGEILGRTGDHRRERNAYFDAIGVVERNDGDTSKFLIAPYVRLGRSHQQQYFDELVAAQSEEGLPEVRLLRNAENFLQKSLDIAQSNPDLEWGLQVDALLAMADFLTLNESHSQARVLYRDAWRIMSENPEGLHRRRLELEVVNPLLQPPLDLSVALPFEVRSKPEDFDLKTGHITTRFTITSRGKLVDFGLVEMLPERIEAIESEVKRGLSQYVYRPRFRGGFATDTPNEVMQFQFPYVETPQNAAMAP
jgi:tetratricopeptide (TPR) repeat protein